MKKAIKILTISFLFIFLITGCQEGLFGPDGSKDGNVIIRIVTDDAARAIRPNNITANDFDRIEITFTQGSLNKFMTLENGEIEGTINLEPGLWNISALGFIDIYENGDPVEAARGTSTVNVAVSGTNNASIELKTGIFPGNPGLFTYNINFGRSISTASMELNPFGASGASSGAGITIDLTANYAGSIDIEPGYYLVSITATDNENQIAIWNQLLHIYSGRITVLPQIDFKFFGTITIGGTVKGGEFNGSHIKSAAVTAYGDSRYLNRITSVNVNSFYVDVNNNRIGYWTMVVPSSFTNNSVFFQVEETLTTPIGDRTQLWNISSVQHVYDGINNIELLASYSFSASPSLNLGFSLENTVTANPYYYSEQMLVYTYPVDIGTRYVYIFDAWTNSSERQLNVFYIYNYEDNVFRSQLININTTQKEFVIISDTPITANSTPALFIDAGTGWNAFNLRLKAIVSVADYTPPNVDETPRFTAVPVAGGIELTLDLRELPPGLRGFRLTNTTTGDIYYLMDWWPANYEYPDTYKILFPYVNAGNAYDFVARLEGNSFGMEFHATATATGGRGELAFSNQSDLLLLKEGNTLRLNTAPQIPSFTKTNIENEDLWFELHKGTNLNDPSHAYGYRYMMGGFVDIGLLDFTKIPAGFVISNFAGQTSYGEVYYQFDYSGNDIFLSGQAGDNFLRGKFRTKSVTSTPFIYPDHAYTSELLIATPHPEGILLTVRKDLLPADTTALQLRTANWANARHWMGSHEWTQDGGRYYDSDTIDIIYPFVVSGRTYDFAVSISTESGEVIERSTATPYAGIGELRYTNESSIRLLYDDNTKTLGFVTPPVISNFDSWHWNVNGTGWRWQFYRGTGWSNAQWVYEEIWWNDLPSSHTFNQEFAEQFPQVAIRLSNQSAFIIAEYIVRYDNRTFNAGQVEAMPITFPFLEVPTWTNPQIYSAFITDENLYLGHNLSIYQGESMYASIENYNWYNYNPVITTTWFINGTSVEPVIVSSWNSGRSIEVSLPTEGLSEGNHSGLVVYEIDGAVFAKEFMFQVRN